MSILTEQLPEAVLIDGKEYPINTDFRVAIKIIEAFESEELTGLEKNEIMLELLYGKKNIPENIEEALEMALRFLDGDCDETENSPGEDDSPGDSRLYSFTQDARYIFSGILQTHGIDITTQEMHWWKFIVLFMDLDKDCFFSQLLSIRSRLKKGTLTKEERQWYNENKKIVDLPEHYSEEEEELLGKFF
ncbi:MAG: hypothetical protein IJ279_04155 [Clostridia bacterium]|nr:hypothetical protein [Clostridia bacterium]